MPRREKNLQFITHDGYPRQGPHQTPMFPDFAGFFHRQVTTPGAKGAICCVAVAEYGGR